MIKRVKFSLQKLGRDKVTELFTQKDITFSSKILTGKELIAALKNKLLEEAQEVSMAQSTEELEEEIADVQEVIEALVQKANLSLEKIAERRAQKCGKFGALLKGCFFETIQVPEQHPDVEHYRANPKKYPELALKD